MGFLPALPDPFDVPSLAAALASALLRGFASRCGGHAADA